MGKAVSYMDLSGHEQFSLAWPFTNEIGKVCKLKIGGREKEIQDKRQREGY